MRAKLLSRQTKPLRGSRSSSRKMLRNRYQTRASAQYQGLKCMQSAHMVRGPDLETSLGVPKCRRAHPLLHLPQRAYAPGLLLGKLTSSDSEISKPRIILSSSSDDSTRWRLALPIHGIDALSRDAEVARIRTEERASLNWEAGRLSDFDC